MRKLILIIVLVALFAPLTGCAPQFSGSVITPAEVYRSFDDRPRVVMLYAGNEADFVSIEDDGYLVARNVRAGQTFSFPVRAFRQYGETRTFFMKGYRVVGSDTTFVGYSCRQFHFQGNGYGAGQSQSWVVDHLISAGERSGGGCY